MLSSNCKIADHGNCSISFEHEKSIKKCECSCHVSNISPLIIQEGKDRVGITREDEMRAETLP